MKFRHFLAPDIDPGGAPAAAPAPAVPAASSPTGMDIPAAPARTQAPAVVVQEQPVVKQKGIVDVKKALGLEKKPSQMVTEASKELRARNNEGKFIPVPKIKSKKVEAAPAPSKEEPAAATPEPAAATPEPAPAAAAPAPTPVKVKIGDKEMTPEEVQAHIATLEAKLKPATPEPAATTGKPAEPAKATLTPEQRKVEEKRLDDEFLADWLKGNPEKKIAAFEGVSQADFDKMIADGDAAGFNRLRAMDQLATRKWLERTLNPILADIFEFRDTAKGAVEMHQQVAQYTAEAAFLEKHQDLKPHLATVRNVRKVLAEKYPTEWAGMTPEERDTETANAVRSLPIAPAAATPAPAAAAPAAAAPKPTPKPQPKPPTGQTSAGGNGGGKPVDMTSPQYLLQRGKV